MVNEVRVQHFLAFYISTVVHITSYMSKNGQLQICLETEQHILTEPASRASDLNLEIVVYSGWQSGTMAGSGENGSSG